MSGRRVQLTLAGAALACLVLGIVTGAGVLIVATFVLLVLGVTAGPMVEARRRHERDE